LVTEGLFTRRLSKSRQFYFDLGIPVVMVVLLTPDSKVACSIHAGRVVRVLVNLAEWLRRQTRNLLGFPRAGSNPAVDVFPNVALHRSGSSWNVHETPNNISLSFQNSGVRTLASFIQLLVCEFRRSSLFMCTGELKCFCISIVFLTGLALYLYLWMQFLQQFSSGMNCMHADGNMRHMLTCRTGDCGRLMMIMGQI
jgi:hypothetical protein